MAELPDIEYNRSIPYQWYLHGNWRPTRWAYGAGQYGSQMLGNVYGLYEDDEPIDFTTCAANNLYCLMLYLKKCGWCYKAIMAVAGNLHSESNFNPGQWQDITKIGELHEDGLGFGLVQWTPPNEYIGPAKTTWGVDDPFAPYFENGWYEAYMMASEVFGYPRNQWKKHRKGPGQNPSSGSPTYPDYPGDPPDHNYWITYADFAQGICIDEDVPDTDMDLLDYLTGAFYWCYEQVADYREDHTLYARRTRARAWYNRMLPFFGDFPAETIIRPDLPDSDFNIRDLIPRTPTTPSKLIYYIRPWWQRIGR